MPKIEHIWAFIAVDKSPDDEGVTGFYTSGVFMPMVAADEKRVESLSRIAQQIANASRQKITLARFSLREDLKVIEPSYVPLKG